MGSPRVKGFLYTTLTALLVLICKETYAGFFKKASVEGQFFLPSDSKMKEVIFSCSYWCVKQNCTCFIFENKTCRIGDCSFIKIYEKYVLDTTVWVDTNRINNIKEDLEMKCSLLVIAGADSQGKTLVFGEDIPVQNLPQELVGSAAAVIGKEVWVCGGWNIHHDIFDNCYFRDEAGVWREGPGLRTKRALHGFHSFGSNLVIFGGTDNNKYYLNSVEILGKGDTNWKIANYTLPFYQSYRESCSIKYSEYEMILVAKWGTFNINVESGAVLEYDNQHIQSREYKCALYKDRIMLTDYDIIYTLEYRNMNSRWVSRGSFKKNNYFEFRLIIFQGIPFVFGGQYVYDNDTYANGTYTTRMEMFIDGEWKESSFEAERFYRYSLGAVIC